MTRILGAAFALVFVVACSQGNQNVDTTQDPSHPSGSVVGVVTSLRTGAPLQGVTVSVPGPGGGVVSATTDSNGAYALSGLVAGASYTVRFASTGYVPRFADAPMIPSSAGDYPSNGVVQLDMALAQSNATLKGHVYARDGAPANGVDLAADLRYLGFDLVATATTDAQGAYSLTGLPGAPMGLPVVVVAQPWDANGDGVADYDASSFTGTTYPQTTSLLDLDLRRAAAELLLLTSNVESGTIAANAAIQLTFNQALDTSLTKISLYDSTAGKSAAVVATFDTSGTILTVVPAPSGTALAANHAYTLTVNGVATANGAVLAVSRSFTAKVSTTVLPAVTGLSVTPSNADFDTASFTLSWDASANATGYEVWVRDTNKNPDYLLVKTIGSSPAPSTSVTLPATFDWFSADGTQTPFAFGVGVDFAVVAENAAGALLPSSVTPVHRSDTVKPVVEQAVQTGNADNSLGATARTVTLALTFGEYMDTSVLPTITLPSVDTAAPFVWNANRTAGTFSITINAATDGHGPYTVSGAKDTSGNLMTSRAGTLVSSVQLVTNGDFESGTLSGWTTSYSLTSTAPVATTAAAASGTYSAQLGNATVSTTQSGYSILYQTVTLPAAQSSIMASVSYRPYTNYASAFHDWSACYIQSSTGLSTYATFFTTYQDSTSFTSASADITAYAGLTVRIMCETYQDSFHITGMYLDNVSILATP